MDGLFGDTLLRKHLTIERGHRHLANDIVRLCLIATVDDVSLPLIGEDRSGGCGPVFSIWIDGRAIQLDQRQLDLTDVLPSRTRHDVGRVRDGGGFEFGIATKSCD